MLKYIKINPEDNVAVALQDMKAGEKAEDIELLTNVPAGHKFALSYIAEGEKVIKYGMPIALATRSILPGCWVHTHNVKTGLGGEQEYEYRPDFKPLQQLPTAVFEGFERADGSVGVRNEIWIIPTVGCVGDVAEAIAHEAEKYIHGSVDCVTALTHPYGCSQLGGDMDNTRKILADLARHPNAGGVLLLGLGCENLQAESVLREMEDYDHGRLRVLIAQECGDEIAEGVRIVRELIDIASEDRRTFVDSNKLIIGLKCGGSDGFSGITANPVVGELSDFINAQGGATLLTEVPEMFGAETLLMSRCINREVFDKTVELINGFKEYFTSYGQPVYENPSPGNKKGGISTLEDKSMGCTQKAGTAPVCGVLKYGERITGKGLHLLEAPGNDLVAATALAAAGAQLILFTTGRGTPFSCPVPTVKISTNSELARRKPNWIDVDAGVVAEGASIGNTAFELLENVILFASGRKTAGEKSGYHSMAIFKQGVTL